MRHRKRKTILGRKSAQRKAVIRQLTISLLQHGKIQTTPAKARLVQQFIEPLITRGKTKSVHTIRVIEKRLANKAAALHVVNEIAPKSATRTGGYTRMLQVMNRQGDGAEQVILELVD